MPQDLWHFPRPALADEYLSAFARGLIAARALIAVGGTGKTEFLRQDLTPAAQTAGYLVAYVDLVEARQNPESALSAALDAAVTGAPVTCEITGSQSLASLLYLLDVEKHPLLLIVDEAQELSLPEHSQFAHALRSALDIRKNYIKVMFAGKVAPLMGRVFGDPAAPFYQWCPMDVFPRLGEEFVEAMVAKVADLSRYPLALPDALDAFQKLDGSPSYFRRFLVRYLTHASEGAQAALAATKETIFRSLAYRFRWEKFLPADQLVMAALAAGERDMYSAEVRKRIGQKLGLDAVATSTVQNSLTRLRKANHVVRVNRGEHQIADPAFLRWIVEHTQDAQPPAQPGQPERQSA